ncbi:hypothetical protein [uncultured Imperialibacter sp.]|uniref:hypothetical protein n=1 Tax=uncultured Imperialibacter sp. TaxID=1672639 RepID=UPI0030D85E01
MDKLKGQEGILNNKLSGVWSDKACLDNLVHHNSLTKAFKERGELYDGLLIKNDTLILALHPNAMEEDWLFLNTENGRFENERGYIKISSILNALTIQAEVHFEDQTEIKTFIKVIDEQEATRTNSSLGLHLQRLYRLWFANEYQVIDSNEVIGTLLFTEQGNTEGYIDNSLYNFFLWDENTAILSLENWKTKNNTYYILTYTDSIFHLVQVKEPEWSERPKALKSVGDRITLRRSL